MSGSDSISLVQIQVSSLSLPRAEGAVVVVGPSHDAQGVRSAPALLMDWLMVEMMEQTYINKMSNVREWRRRVTEVKTWDAS